MSEDTEELSLDEAMGLTKYLVPPSPEQDFYDYMVAGAAPRIHNMLYELKHNVEHYKFYKERGLRLTRTRHTEIFNITLKDYVELMVRYYLEMMHLSRFAYNLHDEGGSALPKLDLDKTLALFMEHDGIKKIIREGENKD